MQPSKDTLVIEPADALSGTLRAPGDKSISHRALLLGAIAEGETRIDGLLHSADTEATMRCLRMLGVEIDSKTEETTIDGVGSDGLREPRNDLDCGNSGTTMRLLAGILAGQPFSSTLVGDESLSRRPMARIITPLRMMGARIKASGDGRPPLRISGQRPLEALYYASPVTSAQVKSCLLLAGLYSNGQTVVVEPAASRDHTERMLDAFGCPVERLGNRICLEGGRRLRGIELRVAGDPSAAAFFAVAASIVPGSEIVLEQVGINPTRAGFIEILKQMGADISVENELEISAEPVADLRVRHAPLTGIRIDPYLVAASIDEFPILFIAFACADGATTLSGAGELRVKESDRIAVMAQALRTLGIECSEQSDGLRIEGGRLRGGEVDAAGDHRCAMALAVAGLTADAPVTVNGARNIATSYPNFLGDLKAITGLL